MGASLQFGGKEQDANFLADIEPGRSSVRFLEKIAVYGFGSKLPVLLCKLISARIRDVLGFVIMIRQYFATTIHQV